MGEEKPANGHFIPLHTHPRPQVQVTSQLGARASLELSLRSWLRLASRSLRSISSCVRSVCASVRRDSLCSTADRQAGWRIIRPVPPPQLHPPSPVPEGAENPYPHPSLPQPLQLLPPTTQKSLLVPLPCPWFPLVSCASIPLR